LPAGSGFTFQPIDEVDDGVKAAPRAATDARAGDRYCKVAFAIRVRREDRQRLTIAIDPSYADAGRQQAPHHRPADATCRSGYDRHSLSFGHTWFLPCCRAYPTPVLKEGGVSAE
jgi:hypothetical protein